MSSILTDVKHKIGPSEEFSYYDKDIIDAINLAFSTLTQIGVGVEGFRIEDDTATWDNFTTDPTLLSLVQTYVYEKTRLVFDPPINSFLLSSMEEQLKEMEWRMLTEVNYKEAIQNENP